jgi:hypothetical protein
MSVFHVKLDIPQRFTGSKKPRALSLDIAFEVGRLRGTELPQHRPRRVRETWQWTEQIYKLRWRIQRIARRSDLFCPCVTTSAVRRGKRLLDSQHAITQ